MRSRHTYIRDGADVSRHGLSPCVIFLTRGGDRELITRLVRQDVASRYRASALGLIWTFAHPLLMLAVYTTVFGVFLQLRWPGVDSSLEYSLALFAALIPFNFFSECLIRAPGLVVAHGSYVKKVIFPLEILPWIAAGSAGCHAMINVVVWCIFYAMIHGTLQWTVIFVPLVFMPVVLLALSCLWFVSAVGVYVRDVGHLTAIASTVLMFLSPIFYSVDGVPPRFQALLRANPLTFLVEQARDVMLLGRLPDFSGLLFVTAAGVAVAWLGLAWFQRAREGFADVL